MKINIQPQEKISFQKFCDKHQLSIDVCERNIRKHGLPESMRWYAILANCDVKTHMHSSTTEGCVSNASTPNEAINSLPRELEGKVLVLNATDREYRQNILIPYFTEDKPKTVWVELTVREIEILQEALKS